jgi:hypothetical protein
MASGETVIDLQWGRFAAAQLVGVIWIAAASAAYAGMIEPRAPGPLRLVLAAVVALPPVVWVAIITRRMRRGDEFEQMLEVRGLAQGALYAVLFGVFAIVVEVVCEILGIVHAGAAASQVQVIAVLPALAMMMGRSMIQFSRFTLARPAR